jgi:hypothetical protein
MAATAPDFWSIRTVSLGDKRPALPADIEFDQPRTRGSSIVDLQHWIKDHSRFMAECDLFERRWRGDPTVSDGQWLANLYDRERSRHRIDAYQREITRRREYNRAANRRRGGRRDGRRE